MGSFQRVWNVLREIWELWNRHLWFTFCLGTKHAATGNIIHHFLLERWGDQLSCYTYKLCAWHYTWEWRVGRLVDKQPLTAATQAPQSIWHLTWIDGHWWTRLVHVNSYIVQPNSNMIQTTTHDNNLFHLCWTFLSNYLVWASLISLCKQRYRFVRLCVSLCHKLLFTRIKSQALNLFLVSLVYQVARLFVLRLGEPTLRIKALRTNKSLQPS